jgi:hypothetical protein
VRVMGLQLFRENDMQHSPCGARTRAGGACRAQGRGRGGRCKLHGGASTGPRTEEGRRRMIEAVKARHAARRAALGKPRIGDEKALRAVAERYATPELEDVDQEHLG